MADAAELLEVYDTRLRRVDPLRLPDGVTAEQDGPLLRVTGWHEGFISAPADLGVDGAELDALIARQRDVYAARGEPVEWKTYGYDRPADLPDRLRAAGFVAEPTETVVIGPAAGLADPSPRLPDGVVLRRVDSDADFARIAAMEDQVWGTDRSHLVEALRQRVDTGSVVVAAEAAAGVVAAGWADLEGDSGFASLWGGSTLVAWRHRGLYRALVAWRAAWAVDHGCQWLQVDASDDSRPILERLGFTAVTTTTPYVWTPPPAG
jgi:hypothetical protein